LLFVVVGEALVHYRGFFLPTCWTTWGLVL